MRQVLQAHLKRVTWDEQRFPVRLHPFVVGEAISSGMPIAIDPRVSFGRPVIISRGISTAAIVDRIAAGETVAHVAADYELSVAEIDEAVLYERVACVLSFFTDRNLGPSRADFGRNPDARGRVELWYPRR